MNLALLTGSGVKLSQEVQVAEALHLQLNYLGPMIGCTAECNNLIILQMM